MKTNLRSKKGVLVLSIALAIFSACRKDRGYISTEVKVPEITGTTGVYMLCEGLMGGNSSAITYYDMATKTTIADYYKQVNGTSLGETANDLQQYGSKMYCVVSGIQGSTQSFLDVIDIKSCKSLKRIPFNSATDGYIPRFVTFYKDKAYVSRYDGKVSRIDTASMAIDGEVTLTPGLEGLAVANGKLYVCNSNHYLYANSGKDKVSVIDLTTFTKTKDITVNNNPVKINATADGDLFVVTWGDYGSILPSLDKISSATDTKTGTYAYDLGNLAIAKNTAYVAKDIYSNPEIKPLNITTGALGNSLIPAGTVVNTIYGMTVNGFNNDLVVADANNYDSSKGFAYGFGADGTKKFSFETAGLPQHAVFVYSYK